MKNADRSAMPHKFDSHFDKQPEQCNGLTKREYFAGLVMQGLLSNSAAIGALVDTQNGIPEVMQSMCEKSIELADELLKQLETPNPSTK